MKTLYGIGTGPGASDLLTIRAVEKMKEADVIFVPNNKGKNMALDTAEEYLKGKKIVYLDFPMGQVTDKHYKDGAEEIYKKIEKNSSGAFLTIGDPMIYSTFIYLAQELEAKEDLKIEVVPGIPSFVASAGAAKLQLTEKSDNFVLCDEPSQDILDLADSVAILKTFKNKEETLELLEKNNFSYKYIRRASLEEEAILEDKQEILEEKDYISLILARKDK